MTLHNELKRCEKWIQDALDRGPPTHDFIHIVDLVSTGRMQLWANETSCVVTEIQDFPKMRVLHLFLAGGSLEGIRDLEENALKWSKSVGCTAWTLAGRKGWERALKDNGWEVANRFMIKRLEQ